MQHRRSGFDLAIVGSGSAAFAAAITARGKGASVVMVESGTVGGTCVNSGCVPSKALLAAASTRHTAATADRFPGLGAATISVDVRALIAGKDTLVRQLRDAKYLDLAATHGWEILSGAATFVAGPALQVTGHDGEQTRVEAARYLVATGSAPWVPPIDGLAESGYLTSTTAMALDTVPGSMIVVGGNAVGLEQAQLFARLGTHITVIEARERIAPLDDPALSAALERNLTAEGMTIHTGATLTRVDRDGERVRATATIADASLELTAERALVAAGRRPLTARLGLDAVGVKTGPTGEVLVDQYLRTSNNRIWAAGDVTGGPQFVYVAAAQGTLAADNAFGDTARVLDYTAVPRVTFTSPALAAVGLTEAQANDAGIPTTARTLLMTHVPRALANHDIRGLITLVAHAETGQLIGAHVLAEGAGEIITAATYALSAGLTVGQIATTWHPYLTMAEGLKLAAQTFTRDVATLSCCAS